MCAHDSKLRSKFLVLVAALCTLAATIGAASAEVVDPLAEGPVDPLFPSAAPNAPLNPPATQVPLPDGTGQEQRLNAPAPVTQPIVQPPVQSSAPVPLGDNRPNPQASAAGPVGESKDPCAAIPHKPLGELGINIAQSSGSLPTDLATPCWDQINQKETALRAWSTAVYNWDATCLCHRPLYFEEVNLERYGYQCGDHCCSFPCECCLQPAASAAHFYGSVLALPYCMAAECPGDCVYTLGHYRPGDCNPWRYHWPPCDPLAMLSVGGVYTGLIFAIP
jgi:hypothetical protein